MLRSGVIFSALTLAVVATIVFGLIHHVREGWMAAPDLEGRGGQPAFTRWVIQGLATPVGVIFTWNLVAIAGPSWGWVPLTPRIPQSPAASFFSGTATAGFCIASLWAGLTFAWVLPTVIRGIRRRDELLALTWVVVGAALLFIVAAIWLKGTLLILWIVLAATAVLFHWSLPLVYRPSTSYAAATARLKRGHYAEAEKEVLRQLEEKADDYEGWMFLAQLYAEQFGQLAEADQTVRELCEQPGLSPFHVAQALTRLADWHLNRGDNPKAARAALEEILVRCADTPFARTAENRIRQLPRDDVELREQRQPRVIRLPSLREQSPEETTTNPSRSAVDLADARAEVARLTSRIQEWPDDAATRFRLACALAEKLGQVDAALVHLNQFRQTPRLPESQRIEALGLEAAWRLKLLRDEPGARRLFHLILAEHPGSPQALAARRQLEVLDHPEFHGPTAAQSPPPPTAPRIVVRLDPKPGAESQA